jgi:hypothetical protein
MQCPECGHNVANGRAECLYCGAVLGDAASGDYLAIFENGQETRFCYQVGTEGTVHEVTQVNEQCNSTNDVPEDWEKKIVDAIERNGGGISPDISFEEKDIFSILSHSRTPRRERMHPLILALIFFVSAALVGTVLWLFR